MFPVVLVLGLVSILANENVNAEEIAVPLNYNLRLEPDLEQLTLNGQVTIIVQVKEITESIILNAKYLEIVRVEVSKGNSIIELENYASALDSETLTLNFKSSLEVGLYTIFIDYKAPLNENHEGLYVTSYSYGTAVNQRKFVLSNFYDSNARRVFPCFDNPMLAATFTISVVRPKDYFSLSSGYKSSETEDNDKIVDGYATTEPIPVHLLAVVIIDFPVKTKGDFSVYNFLDEDSDMMLDLSSSVSDSFNRIYTHKLDKIDQIVVPDHSLPFNALHGAGLAIYRSSAVLFNESIGTTKEKQTVLKTIALSFSRQYYLRNQNGHEWWTNIWFTEGLIRFYQYVALIQLQPNWRLDEQFLVENIHNALEKEAEGGGINLVSDIQSISSVLVEENSLFSTKALALIRMLQNYERPGDISEIENEVITYAWAETPGYPILEATRNYENNVVTIKQHSSFNPSRLWSIPINFATIYESHFADLRFTQILENSEGQISNNINSSTWLIINKQQNGFYRVNYDQNNWKLISDYLKGDNFTTIHPINRAQLIDDVFEMVKFRYLDVTAYLELIGYIERETDIIPLTAFFKTAHRMKTLLSKVDVQEKFKAYFQTLIKNIFENVGLNIRPLESHISRLNRIQVLKSACNFDHEVCQAEMFKELANFQIVHPDMEEATHCGGMRLGDISHFMFLYNQYKVNQKDTTLKSLTCTSDATLLQQLLLGLIDNSQYGIVIEPVHKMVAFFAIIEGSDIGVDLALEEIKKDIDIFLQKFSIDDVSKMIVSISQRIVTAEQTAEMRDFIDCLTAETRDLLGTAIEEVERNMIRNMEWREFNINTIDSWLNAHLPATTTVSSSTASTTTTSQTTSTTSLTTSTTSVTTTRTTTPTTTAPPSKPPNSSTGLFKFTLQFYFFTFGVLFTKFVVL